MDFTTKNLPGSIVELTVTVPKEKVDKYMDVVCKELAERTKVPGFRKGHIPRSVLEQQYGEEGLMQMAADKIIQQSYADIIIKEKLNIVGPPEDVQLEGTDPFKFTIKAPIYPEVTLKKYDDIKIKAEKVEVKATDVDEVLENLRAQAAEFKETEGVVADGDKVDIDFEGFDKDKKAIPNTKSENHPAVIGKKQFIPGFEEAMLGMKAGEEKEFPITFPKDYHAKDLAGAKVTFKIKVHKIYEQILPELNEEFLSKMKGDKITLEEFRADVEKEIQNEKEKQEQERQETILMEELMKRTTVELPEVFINQELDQMLHEQKHHLEGQGVDYEMYKREILKKEDHELKEGWKDRAKERIMSKLIVAELLKREEITASDEEVEARIEEIVAGYPGDASREKAKEIYRKDGKYYEPLREKLRVQKLVDLMLEKTVK